MNEALTTEEGKTLVTLPNLSDNPFKHKYLSFRACGFTIREAAQLAGIKEKTVRAWRHLDEEFKELDTTQLKELRENFAEKFIEVEFLRNFRLILKKDYEVIIKSITNPDNLTQHESAYLKQARAHYTPQQLNIIRNALGGDGVREFNYTQFIQNIFGGRTDMDELPKLQAANEDSSP